MKKTFFLLCLLALLSAPASAKNLLLPDVPDTVPDPAYTELKNTRAAIEERTRALNIHIIEFNAACQEVDENSQKAQQCAADQSVIRQEKASLKIIKAQYADNLKKALNALPIPKLTGPYGEVRTLKGEFYLLTKDGHKISGKNIRHIPLGGKVTLVTEKNSTLRVTLPDNTIFTIGPDSEIFVDEFIYDPNTSVRKVTAQVTKGALRWVTGKVANKDPSKINLRIGHSAVGIRGTDFEAFLADDKSGTIKLFSGAIDITTKNSDKKITLEKSGKVELRPDGSVSDPLPLAPDDLPLE